MAIDESKSAGSQWLEDEVHQAKVQLGKLQQQTEQLGNHLVRLTEDEQRMHETLSEMRVQMEGLSTLREQVRLLASDTADLAERRADLQSDMQAYQHQQEGIAERTRLEWTQVLKRLDAIEKSVSTAEQRMASLEEGQRPMRNEAATLRQGIAELERDFEELRTKADRSLEANKRTENTIGRIDVDLASLTKQDEATNERLQLYAEHVRRLEEQFSTILDEQTTIEELSQKLDVIRNEGQYLGERVASLERTMEVQKAQVEEETRVVDLMELKVQGHADRLAEVHKLLIAYQEDLLTHLQRCFS